jgi:hypothetical protein
MVADAPWSDDAVLRQARKYAVAAMTEKEPVAAWVVDDTGFVKKGTHSVGVARQDCGQVGKQENCRVAVSLSVTTQTASLPVAWRLYLPESWAQDPGRREQAGVPEEMSFATKPAIALQQIRGAVEEGIPTAPVLGDAGYGNDTQFRQGVTALGLLYVLGVSSSTTVWKVGEGPLPKKAWSGRGQPPKRLRRDANHRPVAVLTLAQGLQKGRGRASPGGLAPRVGSVRGSPLCGSVRRIGMRSVRNLVPKSGCSSSGRREKPNPLSIGCRPCRWKRKSRTWSAWPSSAGSSNAIMKN